MIVDEMRLKELLSRGVEEIFVKEHLEEELRKGEPFVVKLGIDPTGPEIHLGRAVSLWKLRAFQDLGHHVVLVVGDFTAQIGDPSDKLEKRPMLSEEMVKANMAGYKRSIGKILDLKKTRFVYNSKWLSKLSFKQVTELAESFSVLQMSNRRNFKERLDRGEEVSLREFLYPLMQGYDSVAVNANVELGGFDQLFNLKAGRTIQRHFGMKEQDIVTTQMLEGTDGRKMSTSWGNVVNVTDEPNEMFGKIMSLHDELIVKYFTLATSVTLEEISKIEEGLRRRDNPRDHKLHLAETIVALYHGKGKASRAKKDFINTFQKKEAPAHVREVSVSRGALLADVLVKEGVVASKSEFQRLCASGGISIAEGNKKIADWKAVVEPGTFKVGKHRFIKINVN
ncbi:MAG: tyrosine--tRNA ligase [bacterium]|nr:tyrosine--tRNA ligase [bacterium]